MKKIQIFADSTCDLDAALLKNEELEILPLTITLQEKNYLDGEEINVSAIYDAMRQGIMPKTSQIPYERIYHAFRSCLESGQDFIYIAFSSEMSGCCALANLITEELLAEYPGRRGAVIDSRGGSSATGLIVLQALHMARDELPFETICTEIRFMTEHVEHVFSVDDLLWLVKGGRIPRFIGQVGSRLSIHPILDVENGRIILRRMIRGRQRSIETVANEIIRRASQFPTQLIAISHADDLLSAKTLERLIKEGLPNCKTTLCHIGGVLGVHIGLKGIGAFCFNQKPAHYELV